MSSPTRRTLASSLAAVFTLGQSAVATEPDMHRLDLQAQIDAIGAASVREWKSRHLPRPPRRAGVQPVTSCADDGSPGTLRSVMEGVVSGDTIDLSSLSCSKITLTQGKIQTPFASSDISIIGPGMDALTISGGHESQIIENIGYGNLMISDVSFADGYAYDGFGGCLIASRTGNGFDLTRVRVSGCEAHQVTNRYGGATDGGGIFAIAGIVLTDSIVTHNTLSSEFFSADPGFSAALCGGGAGTFNGPITLTRSVVTYNQIVSAQPTMGSQRGAGLCVSNDGRDVTITDSTISHNAMYSAFLNQSGNYVSVLLGGGLYASTYYPDLATMTITNSTFADNTIHSVNDIVRIFGGGLRTIMKTYIYGSTFSGNNAGYGGGLFPQGRKVKIVNSTISGNHATRWGGGLWVVDTAEIDNSTIAFNTSDTEVGGLVVSANTTLRSSIVANNQGVYTDIFINPGYGVLSGDHNFIGDPGSVVVPPDTKTGDPMLAPLAYNGGPTMTHALITGSGAINGGSNPLGLPTDQRGQGFPRVIGSAADIGAYEVLLDEIFQDGFDLLRSGNFR
jgi:hypothetical protein